MCGGTKTVPVPIIVHTEVHDPHRRVVAKRDVYFEPCPLCTPIRIIFIGEPDPRDEEERPFPKRGWQRKNSKLWKSK